MLYNESINMTYSILNHDLVGNVSFSTYNGTQRPIDFVDKVFLEANDGHKTLRASRMGWVVGFSSDQFCNRP